MSETGYSLQPEVMTKHLVCITDEVFLGRKEHVYFSTVLMLSIHAMYSGLKCTSRCW